MLLHNGKLGFGAALGGGPGKKVRYLAPVSFARTVAAHNCDKLGENPTGIFVVRSLSTPLYPKVRPRLSTIFRII